MGKIVWKDDTVIKAEKEKRKKEEKFLGKDPEKLTTPELLELVKILASRAGLL